ASAAERVARARSFVEDIVNRGQVVYGINTGFGKLANTKIDPDRLQELQRNLILSHASGVGDPLPPDVVRLALLLRANALARGHSGVRPVVIETLLQLLSHDVLPVIPAKGSVGASGDLAPLAHLALVLIGEGEATVDGKVVSGIDALAHCGLVPLVLEAKEGLALINGTQISCAIGAAAWIRSRRLVQLADLCCACTLEALRGSARPFDERVGALRPHPGHLETAARVRGYLAESEILVSHADCDRVQDQYSLRCVPQVHGAVRDALRHVGDVLAREIVSVTDNPLVFPDSGDVISAGNFHAEPLAIPFDYATMAISELASISERRIENMVNPDLSRLPPFLVNDSGLNSGFMIAQVTAAALVSENKVLSHPASVDSIPTSANKEDHVSMAPIAARKFAEVVNNTTWVLAIELLAAHQAMLVGGGDLLPGIGVRAAMQVLDTHIPPWNQDRIMKHDIDAVRRVMDSGELIRAVRAARS
ncbi:MAG: histidine ammonia-lyase, partial [Planctomycetes bacterium]|nr:histidine ammonia-lyase [Planctomycetota bacterium]